MHRSCSLCVFETQGSLVHGPLAVPVDSRDMPALPVFHITTDHAAADTNAAVQEGNVAPSNAPSRSASPGVLADMIAAEVNPCEHETIRMRGARVFAFVLPRNKPWLGSRV